MGALRARFGIRRFSPRPLVCALTGLLGRRHVKRVFAVVAFVPRRVGVSFGIVGFTDETDDVL